MWAPITITSIDRERYGVRQPVAPRILADEQQRADKQCKQWPVAESRKMRERHVPTHEAEFLRRQHGDVACEQQQQPAQGDAAWCRTPDEQPSSGDAQRDERQLNECDGRHGRCSMPRACDGLPE